MDNAATCLDEAIQYIHIDDSVAAVIQIPNKVKNLIINRILTVVHE